MSESNRSRRVVAEIRWGADPGAIVWVGNRTIHQYWPMLSGYFRDILLPPQRRAEESAVTWTWREPGDAKAPSASELASIRKRLKNDHQLFADNLTREVGGGAASQTRGQGNVDELGTAIGTAIAQLVSRGDAELAPFICRTEAGLRIHSWGAPAPAALSYPDSKDRGVSGRVVVRRGSAADFRVVVEDRAGEVVAHTQTDSSGAFRFPKLAPGTYRLWAQHGSNSRFPDGGYELALANESAVDILLRQEDESSVPPSNRRRWRRRVAAGAVGLTVIGLAIWGVMRWQPGMSFASPNSARAGELNSSHAVAPAAAGNQAPAPRAVRSSPTFATLPAAGGTVPTSRAAGGESVDAAESRVMPGSDHAAAGLRLSDTLEEQNLPAATVAGYAGPTAGSKAPAAVAVAPSGAPSTGSSSSQPSGAVKESRAGEAQDANPDSAARAQAVAVSTGTPQSHRNQPRRSVPAKAATEIGERPDPMKRDQPTDESPAESGKSADAVTANDNLPEAKGSASDTAQEPVGSQASEEPAAAQAEAEVAPASMLASARISRADLAESNSRHDAGPAPSGTATLVLPRALSAGTGERWQWTIRVGEWQPRFLRDVVLPTVPVAMNRDEGLGHLRDTLHAALAASMPASFRGTAVSGGVAVEIGDDAWKWEWRTDTGERIEASWDSGGRTAIDFQTLRAAVKNVRLVSATDDVAAEVSRNDAGWIVRVRERSRAWHWIEIANDAGSDIRARRAHAAAPLPAEWLEESVASGAAWRMQRLLVPLAAGMAEVVEGIAWIDVTSGWGLLGQIRITASAR